MQDLDRDSTGSQHDSLTTGSMQNRDKIRAGSGQGLRGTAASLQNLDNISADLRQSFERLQDDDKIHAESRQSRDPAPSPAETTPNRRGSGGAGACGAGAIASSDAALAAACIAKPEGPTGARQRGGGRHRRSWDLSLSTARRAGRWTGPLVLAEGQAEREARRFCITRGGGPRTCCGQILGETAEEVDATSAADSIASRCSTTV